MKGKNEHPEEKQVISSEKSSYFSIKTDAFEMPL